MNYAEIVQAIQDYTETQETSFVATIPTFVRQAEERIFRSIVIPELRKNVIGSLTVSNKYLALPTDVLNVISVAVISPAGDYIYLINKEVDFIREAYPSPNALGTPKFYAQYDGDTISGTGNLILGPTPSAALACEMHYFFDPPSIVTTSNSWLGDNAESALLYGTLLEAYTYLKGDADMMAVYKGRYDDAMDAVGTISDKAKRDSYKNGEPRRSV